MSKSREVTINCRKCNKEFNITIYDSINVDIDPELREEFLYQKIYFHKCPHCGEIHHLPMPVLYHDMTHKFMVQGGTVIDIYNFINMDVTMNGMLDDDNPLTKIKRVGATNTQLAVEKVVALENGLDHRIATAYRVIEAMKYEQFAKENNTPKLFDSYLCYDDDKDIAVIFDLDTDEIPKTICKKLDRKAYDAFEKEVKDLFEGTCDYLFGEDLVSNIVNLSSEEIKLQKSTKAEIAIFNPTKGDPYFVKIPVFNRGLYKENDIVICCDNKNRITSGTIYKVIDDMSIYGMPFNYMDAEYIMRKCKTDGFETSADSNTRVDNKAFLESLIKFDDTRRGFPYELEKNANVILGMTASISMNGMNQQLLEKEYKGNTLLCIYLDQNDLPKEDNHEVVSNMIFKFEDVVTFVINQPHKYDGIIINPNKEGIVLSTPNLVGLYLPDRILTDDSRTIELLQKLNDKEIDFIGEDNYKYITMVYFENKNPKQISKELNLAVDNIGKGITEGYERLKAIIKCNY